LWVRNIPVEFEGCKWTYERSYIWTAEKALKPYWADNPGNIDGCRKKFGWPWFIQIRTCFKTKKIRVKSIINVCLIVFISVHFLFGISFCKTEANYLHANFGWPKNSHQDDQKVAAPA